MHKMILGVRKIFRGLFIKYLLILIIISGYAVAQEFALHDGDTVVFYGDSITAQRLYTKFVEDFVLTRYPTFHIRFFNAGVPGDTVYGGYAGAMADRVKRDVTPYHPTMITVMLGMNDGGYVPFSSKMDELFRNGYQSLLNALRKAAPDAVITLIRPSPYDEITHGTDFPGYSAVIQRNAEDVSAEAAQLQSNMKNGVFLADFYQPLVNALRSATRQYPDLSPLIVPDRIHPGDIGHWIMAAQLLSTWHVNPVVSRVVLNTMKLEVVSAENTKVEGFQNTPNGLRWTQLDRSLPLPLDPSDALNQLLFKVSDIADLDEEILRVTTLPPGDYQLVIDGKTIAHFSNDELQTGVNLALYATPMLNQARDIEWHEQRSATLDQARFILSAEATQTNGSSVAKETLENAEDELAATVRTKLEIKQHTFELQRK